MALRPCLSAGLPLSVSCIVSGLFTAGLCSHVNAPFNCDNSAWLALSLSIYICFGLYFPRLQGIALALHSDEQ
jgi:hypothetical protein